MRRKNKKDAAVWRPGYRNAYTVIHQTPVELFIPFLARQQHFGFPGRVLRWMFEPSPDDQKVSP
jgi:hypothetical protein